LRYFLRIFGRWDFLILLTLLIFELKLGEFNPPAFIGPDHFVGPTNILLVNFLVCDLLILSLFRIGSLCLDGCGLICGATWVALSVLLLLLWEWLGRERDGVLGPLGGETLELKPSTTSGLKLKCTQV
jgi:hypothetical protein